MQISEFILGVTITIAVLTSLLSIPVSIAYIVHKNDVLVSQQTTCYGKVMQRSWNTDAVKAMEIQACGGK